MLPSVSIFEKHKICSNRTKSLLIVNLSNIISKINEDFAMERYSVIYKTLLKSFWKLFLTLSFFDKYFDLSQFSMC